MNNRKVGDTGIFFPEWFWEQGFRFADILILVSKGKTEKVAREIYHKFDNVLVTSWRINTIANLAVQAYYKDSVELKDMIEGIHEIDNVERVEFSEYVHILHRKSYEEVEQDIVIQSNEVEFECQSQKFVLYIPRNPSKLKHKLRDIPVLINTFYIFA